MKAAILSKQEH